MNVAIVVLLAIASLVYLLWWLIPDFPETTSGPEQHFRELNRQFRKATPDVAPYSAASKNGGRALDSPAIEVREQQIYQPVG